MDNKQKVIRIGGASGYWGEAAFATTQLINAGDLDYLVYDYLAEITMSIMARARAANADLGYATDFVSAALAPNLKAIASQGIKVISNAGGINPEACGRAARELINKQGVDLKVAVITGDDLFDQAERFSAEKVVEMFSEDSFPKPGSVASINAYLGAAPIANALKSGADIVITGRCVDSAVTLGACLYEFDWALDDFDKLSQASVAGHLIECGPQATGGNFTDWRDVKNRFADIGYPIVEMHNNGDFFLTKPADTGGVVSKGSVAEQLLYEIGDPQRYLLPDVSCDFTNVTIDEQDGERVLVKGATGSPPPDTYKVSATHVDGYKAAMAMSFVGFDGAEKARVHADAGLKRANKLLAGAGFEPFSEVNVEIVGAGEQFGEHHSDAQEVDLKIAVRHGERKGVGMFIRAMSGLGLGAPPGLALFQAGRPKPSPVVRLFSFLVPKNEISIQINDGENTVSMQDQLFDRERYKRSVNMEIPVTASDSGPMTGVPLIKLAWGRSGDKGDKANIGIIARDERFIPWIWSALDEAAIMDRFSQFSPSGVERFFLPGTGAINYVLHDVLGGGGMASIRLDPQGKAYAQILLHHEIPIPNELAEQIA